MKSLRNVAIVLLAIALFGSFVSCDTEIPEPSFTPTNSQKKAYGKVIDKIEAWCGTKGLFVEPIDWVAYAVNQQNLVLAKPFGFVVYDTKAGTSIEAGTTRKQLEERFKMKACTLLSGYKNDDQIALYDYSIDVLFRNAAQGDYSVDSVNDFLEEANTVAHVYGFHIIDNEPDTPIVKGTTEADLKTRFEMQEYVFEPTAAQQTAFDTFLNNVVAALSVGQMTPENIASTVASYNEDRTENGWGFIVIDTKAGAGVPQNTTKETLKDRLKMKAQLVL